MISPEVLRDASKYRTNFQTATPYGHVCIDDFFKPDDIEALYREFPAFDKKRALNEYGEVGTNCCINDIAKIGETYRRVYDYVISREFCEILEQLTGIPGIIADPRLAGGGTHQNLNGHDLHPHLDFNRGSDDTWRRLNLLLYMTKDWAPEWGRDRGHRRRAQVRRAGVQTLRLGLQPLRDFRDERIPSWHGYRKLRIPEELIRRNEDGIAVEPSRKLLSLYYYTKIRA
ncbi:MAG: hypothetical protein QM811_24705 [Pirellulales bacterium]